MSIEQTDVLVVGAGPTGLVLAASLAANGVSFRLIEREMTRNPHSRALVVQARSLELLDRFGLAEPLIERGRKGLGAALFVEGEQAALMSLGDIGIDDTAFPYMLFASQVQTEQVLDEHLDRIGVVIERGLCLERFTQDEDGVTAVLQGPEGERTVRCRYIVGCDGAHSVVRKQSGISFEGAPYAQDFVLTDVQLDWVPAADGLQVFLEKKQFAAVFPIAKPNLWRIMASRIDVSADAPDPTLEEMQAIMDAVCPTPVRLHDPIWLTRFRLHHRGVDRYRVGRAFVAGDAAHIHSPAGGQGMNTGMQDAYNLGWKLALALRGAHHPALLDSYHAERFPIGKKLLDFTDRTFSMLVSQSGLLASLRNFLVPIVAPRVMESRQRRARAFRFASQLAVRYSHSPIVEEQTAGSDALFREGPHPGSRVPDGWLKDPADGEPVRLQSLLHPARHHVFVFTGRDPSIGHADIELALGELRQRFAGLVDARVVIGRQLTVQGDVALLDEDGELHKRLGLSGSGVIVVRPDGVIGFRSPGVDLVSAASFLARHLG